MRKTIKTLIATVAVCATVLAATTPASANRNECAGDAEVSCEYCSYNNGADAQPGSYCDNNVPGYTWQGCATYAGGRCVVGAASGGPVGRPCGHRSSTDLTREAGWRTGYLYAGPLVTGEAGTLVCSIVVNGHLLLEERVAASRNGIVVLVPVSTNHQAIGADTVSLCTRWEGASGTLYWRSGDPANPTDLGSWSSTSAGCDEVPNLKSNDPECSIWLAVDRRLGTNIAEIWQDCEGYAPIIRATTFAG